MSNIIEINDDNFEQEVLQSDIPVLVDFNATWCAPCKRLHPIIEKFADDNLGKIKVCSLDIDDSVKYTSMYYIRSVPTLISFKNGLKIDQKVGLVSAAQIAAMF